MADPVSALSASALHVQVVIEIDSGVVDDDDDEDISAAAAGLRQCNNLNHLKLTCHVPPSPPSSALYGEAEPSSMEPFVNAHNKRARYSNSINTAAACE